MDPVPTEFKPKIQINQRPMVMTSRQNAPIKTFVMPGEPVPVPAIRMDKVPAVARGEKGGLQTAQEAPLEIYDMSKNPPVRYFRGRFLGKGGFAKCFEITPENSQDILACKIVNKNMLVKDHHREKMAQEIMLHRSLQHRNIVGFHSYFEDDQFVYIVLEVCEKKSLMELSKRRRTISEPEARYFLRQICEAVMYLHDDKRIIHRDLKLGNIFIAANMDLKIGDFGLATQLEGDDLRKRTMCGTPNYIAPEVLSKTGHGFEVDIWSIGCILYTLLIGKPPFETNSLKETYKKIRAGDFQLPRTNLSLQARTLIKRLLQVDPRKRPTAKDILADDYLARSFIPDSLPISALTMAPRFPSTSAQAKMPVQKKPLQVSSQPNIHTVFTANDANTLVPEGQKPRKNISMMDVADGSSDSMSLDNDVIPMVELLKSMQVQMSHVLEGIKSLVLPETDDEIEDPSLAPMLFIIKWVDYSDKYGFGYQLSDDSIGVTYNDQTKLILLPDESSVTYVSKDGVESYYSMKTHPEFLYKKIKLMQYFQQYMKENLLRSVSTTNSDTSCIPRLPTMYTWFRTSKSVVMALTNGTVQINNFKTHRKIIVCPAMGAISIAEPNQAMRTFKLTSMIEHGCTEYMKDDLLYAYEKLNAIFLANERSKNQLKELTVGTGATVPANSANSKQSV